MCGACWHSACYACFAGGRRGNSHVSGHGLAGLHPLDQAQQMEQAPELPSLPMPHLSGELLFVMSLHMTDAFGLMLKEMPESAQATSFNIHIVNSCALIPKECH